MPEGPVTPSSLLDEITSQLDLLAEVADVRRDPLKIGGTCEQMSIYYRAQGICQLSGDGDVDGFFHCLVQSALTRRHYLQVAATVGGGEAAYRRASFLDPVFDAVAGRQWRLAADILARVSPAWLQGEEYEDDFCYADFIRRTITESGAGVDALLAHWEKVLEGAADGRLDIAKALYARDAVAFADALRALIDGQEAKARQDADLETCSLRSDESTFFPNRWVFVEGLALLALAERQGVDAPDLFPACPPLARAGVFGPFRSRGYPHVSYVKE